MTLVSEFSASHLCRGGALLTRPPGRARVMNFSRRVSGIKNDSGLQSSVELFGKAACRNRKPLSSTCNLFVPAAVATCDGFENLQLAPLKHTRLYGQNERVQTDRKERERDEYNILDGVALGEVRGRD